MMDDVIEAQSFRLKGRLYTLTVLHLFNADLDLFVEQLTKAIQQAPRLFEDTSMVLDCSALVDLSIDLELFCQKMRELRVYPVGIQGGSAAIQNIAQKLGLPILRASAQQDKPLRERQSKDTDSVQTTSETPKTKFYASPIRSGQQIVSGGDLIVTSPVSHGAELLAEGNIHIYGALRGRALAGITGDKQARIFCQALEAELIAIAGIYCLSDAMQIKPGPCQIFLKDDCIQIESL